MSYRSMDFPIPTPAQRMTLGAAPDFMLMEPNPMPRSVLPPFRIVNTRQSGAGTTFVPVSGGFLNLNTGEIVDGETMQNVAQASTVNPSILTAPAASLPASIASQGVQNQVQSGTLATAASTGLTAGSPTSWFQGTTSIGGFNIPNWAIAAGGAVFALSLLGGKRGRR